MKMQAARWLDTLSAALARNDPAGAAGLFAPESYWRDLVAFTWNIKTAEGRDEIRRMLEATLAGTRPTNFNINGEPRESNGVTEAWFTFETAVGRGVGHLRLKEGRCWTLLTALRELKGFEEKSGFERNTDPGLGTTSQPYVLIVGGGQGGIGLAARLKRLGVPAIVVEKNARAGDSWRKRYAVALPARPGLVRPHALPAVPRGLAGVFAQGHDGRLAGDVHEGDGARVLERHAMRGRAP